MKMLEMKRAGKTVEEIKAYVVETKKKNASMFRFLEHVECFSFFLI
jgi:hypothetical protein